MFLPESEDDDIDNYPEPQVTALTHHCYSAIVTPTDTTGQIYTDQTGRFLVPGSTGATQLFVLYDYDSNSIHAEPMLNKTSGEIIQAYSKVYNRLLKAGLKPQLHRLDNECSTELKDFMSEKQVKLQLVPPGVHRANAAERAIRTLKNHFIAGLSTTDPDFKLHLWDRLIPQCVLTLNLLRASRINPQLSAYAQVWGQFSYNNTPIAPPGCHVMVHEKPHQRASWGTHAVDAWYLGPALDHYRGLQGIHMVHQTRKNYRHPNVAPKNSKATTTQSNRSHNPEHGRNNNSPKTPSPTECTITRISSTRRSHKGTTQISRNIH